MPPQHARMWRMACRWFGLMLAGGNLLAAETIIFDMDTVRHRPGEITKGEVKMPIGSVETVEGKFNRAVRFCFTADCGPGFMTASVKPGPEWDRSAGFSFYLKGDGSTNFGGLELIDSSDYSLRYGYCFALNSTQWTKIVVPWCDLIPELAAPLVEAHYGYAPSRFGNFWFGKWFYWRDYPASAFAIDQVALEMELPAQTPPRFEPGLKRLRTRLAAHQPVTLVTMGDSLTDKRHWANRDLLWCEELARLLKNEYGSEVRLINPAIGGTTLSQNLILMPRWLVEAPEPELVTVWFGGNDWDSGVRGPRFKEYLELAIHRIRRLTHGKTDILLITTCPGFKRYETTLELENSVREVAQAKETGLADIASAFRKPGSADAALKSGYWAWDNIHLGTNGHKLVAEVVFTALRN